MTGSQVLELEQIRSALAQLDVLSRAEYGMGLEELLLDTDPKAAMRMQRLTGIVLKQKFATAGPAPGYSATGAKRSWPWSPGSPETAAAGTRELELLNELRMPGPWNERKPLSGTAEDHVPITWAQFRDDVEHERGLFKVVALYVADKVKGRETKTLREYFDAKESRRFEAGLDLAMQVHDYAVMPLVLSALGVPAVAIGVVLVGVQFGFRKLTDPEEDRIGDGSS